MPDCRQLGYRSRRVLEFFDPNIEDEKMGLHLKDVTILFCIGGFLAIATATSAQLYAGFGTAFFLTKDSGVSVRRAGLTFFYQRDGIDYETTAQYLRPWAAWTISLGTADERQRRRDTWNREDAYRRVLTVEQREAIERGEQVTIKPKP